MHSGFALRGSVLRAAHASSCAPLSLDRARRGGRFCQSGGRTHHHPATYRPALTQRAVPPLPPPLLSSRQVASIGGGNTAVGEGTTVVLAASGSFDPDGGDGGPLSFSWSCAAAAAAAAAAAPPSGGTAKPCQTADGGPLAIAAAATAPLRLLGSPGGANYTLSVAVSKGDRVATASSWLVVFAGKRLPVISLAGIPTGSRANPSAKLTLKATVTSADSPSLSVGWSVVSVTPVPAQPFNLSAAAATPLSSPSLVISPGALPARSTVVLRLSADDSGGSSAAEVAVAVSGTPYGSLPGQPVGAVSVSPGEGTGLNTSFTVRCSNWTDTDLPLSYAFYYTVDGQPDGAPPVQISDFRPQPSVSARRPAPGRRPLAGEPPAGVLRGAERSGRHGPVGPRRRPRAVGRVAPGGPGQAVRPRRETVRGRPQPGSHRKPGLRPFGGFRALVPSLRWSLRGAAPEAGAAGGGRG